MPGPKKAAGAAGLAPAGGAGLIQRVNETGPDASALPSTEPYLSKKQVRMRGPDGYYEETEFSWTKRGLSRWLAACPKVMVNVPRDPTTDPDDLNKPALMPIYYDGYLFEVPKGESVMVPQPIAEIIANTQTKYRTAQAQGVRLFEITRDNPDGYEIDAGELGMARAGYADAG